MDAAARLTIDDVIGPLDFDPAALKKRYEAERDKRIRPEGNSQYIEVTAEFSNYDLDPWVDPGFKREPVTAHTHVIVAGGGYGGLLVGARLHEQGVTDVRVIEEAGDFGGTWYWNRYPGAMCDIEAHMYLPLLEELNYAPKNRYSFAPEMLDLCRKIGRHYGLYDKALFQTKITDARWLEDEKKWLIQTDRGDRLTADFFVLACGRQSLPKLPGIPGINEFKAHTFHSSRWDYRYTGGNESDGRLVNLKDKRVGIIGTGASAIQIVPEVAKWAKQFYVFQRTPSTVYRRDNCETPPDWIDMSKPGWQDERRVNFQRIISGTRQDVDLVNDGWTAIRGDLATYKPNEIAEKLGRPLTPAEVKYCAELGDYIVMNEIRARIDNVVKDPETAEALKPWYRWPCKRPCFHDDYLEAFNSPNTKLVDTHGIGIERFTENAVVVDGKAYEVDCLIFATGFESVANYVHLIGFDIVGREGVKLSEHWGKYVRTLYG
ncbi:MAG: flavin-containing monooxygenase, partial [Hyphomonadaceae bacterium]